ncbi:MAG: type II secretion system protein [Planctomycetes bacterium]|nr:type II secretion system protein [Planctomycetota bacterium]
MKKAFTLVELLIVVAILGILAALVVPEFTTNSLQATEVVAKENLRIIRQQIELYMVQQVIEESGLDGFPENPFNGLKNYDTIVMGPMPTEATGTYGWIMYMPTKTVKLDWPGTDAEGVRYFDY